MIVYNVLRRWFTEKAEAENYRKLEGLKPSATLKIVVGGRDDLAQLLNALCEPPPEAPNVGGWLGDLQTAADRAFVPINTPVPDCVPLFLISDSEQRTAVEEDRKRRGVE